MSLLNFLESYYDFFDNFIYKSDFCSIAEVFSEPFFCDIFFSQVLFFLRWVSYLSLENINNFFIDSWIILIFDLFLYYLWILFWLLFRKISYFKNFSYNNANLFYIYFRIIPIFWNFSVFFWAFLSDNTEFKNDLKKIFIGNVFFIIFTLFFWSVISLYFPNILSELRK